MNEELTWDFLSRIDITSHHKHDMNSNDFTQPIHFLYFQQRTTLLQWSLYLSMVTSAWVSQVHGAGCQWHVPPHQSVDPIAAGTILLQMKKSLYTNKVWILIKKREIIKEEDWYWKCPPILSDHWKNAVFLYKFFNAPIETSICQLSEVVNRLLWCSKGLTYVFILWALILNINFVKVF